MPVLAREMEFFCCRILQEGIEAAKFSDNDCSELELFSVDFGNDIRRYLTECGEITRILSLNGIIETTQGSFDGALALSEKTKRIAEAIKEMMGSRKPEIDTDVAAPYAHSREMPYMIDYRIGEHRFVERVDRIIEIVFLNPDQMEQADLDNEYFSEWLCLRGDNLPVLVPREGFAGKEETSPLGSLGIRVALGDAPNAPTFLVAVDEIVDAYRLPVGVPAEQRAEGIRPEFVQTAWERRTGQHVFLNWQTFTDEDGLRSMSAKIAGLELSR